MRQPTEVRFLGLPHSAALDSVTRAKAAALDRLRGDLQACRVTIELAHKHRHQGREFAVRIELTLPGRTLTVNRVHDEDVHLALRDAFDDMRRQVEGSVRDPREGPAAEAAEDAAPTSSGG